jgi:hypothetical protein
MIEIVPRRAFDERRTVRIMNLLRNSKLKNKNPQGIPARKAAA